MLGMTGDPLPTPRHPPCSKLRILTAHLGCNGLLQEKNVFIMLIVAFGPNSFVDSAPGELVGMT